ncbi:MAG: PKD domain-containing protein [Bacteroidetes bacterium]|nr:PKD domain-containing protein [Bacteroidota bacterium]
MNYPRIPFIAIISFVFLVDAGSLNAQNPTNQDCLDAIPICQNVYSTTASYVGEGNYPNEINSNISCLGSGELNDVWYTFTVQQSGTLNFLITPNNMNDDYDWAVFNLTNNNCSDIFTNPGLQVSCNFSADPGNTGPNGGSTSTSQNASGTPFNQVVPVIVGQTYVVNVSNYSSTQNGYTINFGASTAVIFDQTPPQILTVTNPGCGGNTLTVTFSENILCNTVQNSDFSFTGPGGPYTVTNVTSAACAAGAQYDNQFTLTISPAITSAGTYTANLVGPVTDLCGNIAIFPAQLPFTVGTFTWTNSSIPASCNSSTGTATVTPSGSGPYTYTWNPNVSSTNSASGLVAGVYTVTVVQQSNGCTAIDTIHVNSTNTLNVATSGDTTICPGGTTTLTAIISGGNAPFIYTWSNSLPNSASVNVSPAASTTYTLNVSDAAGCLAGPLLFTVTIAGPVSVTASGASPICVGGGTTLTAVGAGGEGTFTYNWMPGNINGGTVTVTPAITTTYTVTASDGCGQTSTQAITIVVNQVPIVLFSADTTHGCTPLLVHFTLDTTGFGNAVFLWNFDDNGATSSNSNPTHSFITPGCHDISLTVTVPPGCSVTKIDSCLINTMAQPIAAFTASPSFTSILHPTIYFNNNSSNATIWYWNYGDTTSSINYEESHTYQTPGTYPVYLIATNDSGCTDTAWENIIVNDYHTFFIPTAFTPNNNGLNDIFIPVFTNILSVDYRFLIFDRWGNLIFESNDPNLGWNGQWKNSGKLVEQDVYVYTIDYTDNMYEKHRLIGHVTLLR